MTARPVPSGSSAAGPGTTTQEYNVRVPNSKDRKKKLSMMKFGSGPGVDFSKLGEMAVKMERENNFREYKTANDLELMPKFGAGSEYGREQKEEARRKKYGIILKKYNPEDQPWHMKVGGGKQARKFRGVREGTITENTAYYIFTQCADGAFEAFPVDEWYNFAPMIRYKYLNSEEAEEEFSRRDKTLNYFNIMLKKRVKNEDIDGELDEEEKAAKAKATKSRKNKDFMLTDMDDWGNFSDEDEDETDDEKDDEEKKDEDKPSKTKKGKANATTKKKVKNAKQNSDDEAIEESDEGDFDDKEVDYMSDSSSSGLSEPDEKDKKYDEKGVAEEDGLRNILNSDDDDEEENKEDDEENEDEDKKTDDKPKEKKGEESSSSSSDSDSDIDKDERITSALLMQRDKGEKKKINDKGDASASVSVDSVDSKSLKRKGDGDAPPEKKFKKDQPTPLFGAAGSDGITEDAIRRYLQRKPMTTKDLLQKFASKKLNLTREQMTHLIVQLLKKINPERTTINKKLYLSLKKPE